MSNTDQLHDQLQDVYICPSFSSYSSDRLVEIAGRVAVETSAAAGAGDDDFEFSFVREDDELEVLAEDFFRDGQIRQVFPVFKRQMYDGGSEPPPEDSSVAISLGNLFIEEDRDRDYPPSCSSSASEVDEELENVPAGTYCVWRPKPAEPAPLPTQCEKSKSTGSASSGRWKLRDLMRRSKSDGKESIVFLTPKGKRSAAARSGTAGGSSGGSGRVVLRSSSGIGGRSAHEEFYVRNKAIKEGDRKKSYLPYRQELVGFFANVNGLSRSRLAHI